MINSRVRAAAAGRPHTARVLEYVGVVALAVVLVVGIALAGWRSELRALTSQAFCSLTPQPGCADRSPDTP